MYACEAWGAYISLPSKCMANDCLSGYFKFEYQKLYMSFLKNVWEYIERCQILRFLVSLGIRRYHLKYYDLPTDSYGLYDSYLCNITLH